MSTPIRVGEILDCPRPASSAKVTGSQMQDSTALLEQLLQVARISALEEMASGIAHELNQPIGAIASSLRRASACSNARNRWLGLQPRCCDTSATKH